MPKIAKTVCKVLGVLFFVFGIVGLVIVGEKARFYHDLVHLVTGLIALYFGFAGSLPGAKGVCLALGVFYLLVLGVPGFVSLVTENPVINSIWNPGPLHQSSGDHGFHSVIGAIFLTGGLFTKGDGSQKSR